MLDTNFICENIDLIKKNCLQRFVTIDVDEIVVLNNFRKEKNRKLDELRRIRNENSRKVKIVKQDEKNSLIEIGKQLKQEISALEREIQTVEQNLHELVCLVPNLTHPDAPIALDEKDSVELRRSGVIREFDFEPKDHLEICLDLDLADFETAAKVSGTKFYYLKNEAVFLELALIRYALDKLSQKGFKPFITPDIARKSVVEALGFYSRGEEENIYSLERNEGCLIGTAEITLGGYLQGESIAADNLPVKMAGISHCFRREAGAAGKFSKGLYRVHQFSKVEMFVFSLPEHSDKIHKEMVATEEEIFTELGIPYRVVDICSGDLGAMAYRKFDLEAWLPGRKDWGEITSCSNCTDYQARRLKIKYKEEKTREFLHTLNGTAVAVSRAIIAILENYQQKDGSVLIPQVLRNYCGFEKISRQRS